MLKYINYGIVFQEIPDEVTLSINISNCPCRCPGCHSNYLWEDNGEILNEDTLARFVNDFSSSITCICFMGGDAEPAEVNELAKFLNKEYPKLKVAWYSGRTRISSDIDLKNFNYVKVGPYIKHLGALKEKTTNQRLYMVCEDYSLDDITSRFWKK